MNEPDCKHPEEMLRDYCDSGPCPTPYCDWMEVYCTKCRRYIVTCGCGFENGESGWPRKRYMVLWRNKERKFLKILEERGVIQ